jgi:predicted Rossmann-fold nucleotide-binding protein
VAGCVALGGATLRIVGSGSWRREPGVSEKIEPRVLVFCGSSESCDAKYLADAALAGRVPVLGIQPRFMRDLGWSHAGITELVVADDMRERLSRMLGAADAIVALPGGSGTPEEIPAAIREMPDWPEGSLAFAAA